MGKKPKKTEPGVTLVCSFPKAHQRYSIEGKVEAGLVLIGSEVKSLRAKHAVLDGAYASFQGRELFLNKMHIGPYAQAGAFGHEATRPRKLLLNRAEIKRLQGKLTVRGYTLVPLRCYFRDGWAKVELGLGKGKNQGDQRQDLKKKAADRETRVAMAARNRGQK